MSRNEEKDIINTFKHNEKIHSTMKENSFIPLYAEHIHFLVSRAGWLVTKIYAHYTSEQSPFKKEFVTMNQFARQKAETSVKKDFYKPMNNANFGIDCRNNIDNCQFEAIYDEIGAISFKKKKSKYIWHFTIKSFCL